MAVRTGAGRKWELFGAMVVDLAGGHLEDFQAGIAGGIASLKARSEPIQTAAKRGRPAKARKREAAMAT